MHRARQLTGALDSARLMYSTFRSWSTPADKCALDFPAKTLIRFFHNHHLMQVDGRPNWLTVAGGS